MDIIIDRNCSKKSIIGREKNIISLKPMGDQLTHETLRDVWIYVSLYVGACDLHTWGSGERGMLGHKDKDNEKLPV